MLKIMNIHSHKLFICMILLSLSGMSFADSEFKATKSPDDWTILVNGYAWVPDILVTAKDDSGRFKITQDQVIDNLDGAIMLYTGARKGKWSIYLDTIYVDLKGDDSTTTTLGGLTPGTNAEVDIGVRAWLLTFWGGYAVVAEDKHRIEAIVGGRYYWEKLTFKLQVGPGETKLDDTFSIWDGVVGIKGASYLNDNWYISYFGDVGTGDSDLTYQLFSSINYEFKNVTLAAGYRYFEWQFDENDDNAGELADKQIVKGPFLGFKFVF